MVDKGRWDRMGWDLEGERRVGSGVREDERGKVGRSSGPDREAFLYLLVASS